MTPAAGTLRLSEGPDDHPQGPTPLLRLGPASRPDLHTALIQRTGHAEPLNLGQIYSTPRRLQRDGRVATTQDDTEDATSFVLTPAGVDEVDSWFATDVECGTPRRDQLKTKIASACAAPDVDELAVVQEARTDLQRILQRQMQPQQQQQRSTGLAEPVTAVELDSRLSLDLAVFRTEGRLRWLDNAALRMHPRDA